MNLLKTAKQVNLKLFLKYLQTNSLDLIQQQRHQYKFRIMIDSTKASVPPQDNLMDQQESILKELMLEQYYNYITLLRLTNNFQRKLANYEKIDFSKFSEKIAIVGSIVQIMPERVPFYEDYCFPLIQTPINKFLFISEEPHIKKADIAIRRKLIVPNVQYIKTLLVPFNKIVNLCKKQKNQNFIFTHLKMHLKNENEICFALTQNSFINQLDPDYYQGIFKPLQDSLQYNYSELNINQVFNDFKSPKGSTFVINDFKSQMSQNINNMTILGVLKSVNRQLMKRQVNAKQREAVIDIIQDIYPASYKSIGICRIYIRFDIGEAQQMEKHLQEGCVYIICARQIILNDSLNITFKVDHWKKNCIRVTTKPIKMKSIEQRYADMQTNLLTQLTRPFVYRNLMKFKVFKFDLKFLFLKVTCQKCNNSCVRLGEYQYRCNIGCQEVVGKLKLWAIIAVMDSSSAAELDIEDQQVLKFFGIEQEQLKIKDEVLKELQSKNGITLYFKRSKQQGQNNYFNQGMIYGNNEYLKKILYKCLINIVEKQVIGVARSNMNEYFQNFSEDVKNEFQIGFTRTKEYLKKAKVFANGNLKDFGDTIKLIPHIKVERVLNTEMK